MADGSDGSDDSNGNRELIDPTKRFVLLAPFSFYLTFALLASLATTLFCWYHLPSI